MPNQKKKPGSRPQPPLGPWLDKPKLSLTPVSDFDLNKISKLTGLPNKNVTLNGGYSQGYPEQSPTRLRLLKKGENKQSEAKAKLTASPYWAPKM